MYSVCTLRTWKKKQGKLLKSGVKILLVDSSFGVQFDTGQTIRIYITTKHTKGTKTDKTGWKADFTATFKVWAAPVIGCVPRTGLSHSNRIQCRNLNGISVYLTPLKSQISVAKFGA